MNELRLRAWDKKAKKMRVVDSVAFDRMTGLVKVVNMWGYCVIEQKDMIVHKDAKYVELMRFAGMQDKNGIGIYEADIVRLVNADMSEILVVCEYGIARREVVGAFYPVEVDIPCFYFKVPNGHKTFPIVNNYAGKHDLELFEVVGNIYQNKELLDGSSSTGSK